MTLTHADFKLDSPKPSSAMTDAEWWFWLRCKELEPNSLLGGIYANKPGFHNKGQNLRDYGMGNWQTDYSIKQAVNRRGEWWLGYSSAFDWTFRDAQAGNYATISKYTARLVKSSLDPNDPRLDLILYEFYGQTDWDREVEGYNEYEERWVTSDPSHLWHLHLSFLRSKCGDMWAMWALLTVLMGWTVSQWKASLPGAVTTPPVVPGNPGVPVHRAGSRTLAYNASQPVMVGTDVQLFQKWVGITADGYFGPNTREAAMRYQRMRGIVADGIVGPITWAPILAALRMT